MCRINSLYSRQSRDARNVGGGSHSPRSEPGIAVRRLTIRYGVRRACSRLGLRDLSRCNRLQRDPVRSLPLSLPTTKCVIPTGGPAMPDRSGGTCRRRCLKLPTCQAPRLTVTPFPRNDKLSLLRESEVAHMPLQRRVALPLVEARPEQYVGLCARLQEREALADTESRALDRLAAAVAHG